MGNQVQIVDTSIKSQPDLTILKGMTKPVVVVYRLLVDSVGGRKPGKDQLVVGMENGALLAWDLRRNRLGKDVDLTPYLRDGWIDIDDRKQLFAAWNASSRSADLRAFQPGTSGEARPAFVNSLGMRMIRVEPGTFTMGDKVDGSAHPVQITKPLWLGQYEVTQAE